MSHSTPTPAHVRILELLGAFDYLTTRQVHEYLGATTTKWATVHKLKRLEQHAFVRGERLEPHRGAVSELSWRLLPKGADLIGKPLQEPAEEASISMAPGQEVILRLLAEMKQLSTKQIWRHLHKERSVHYTRLLLRRLRNACYVHSRQLYPERGAASEHYWMLSKRGAAAIGIHYDMRYRRRPVRQTIEHRGLLLELSRQVHVAGWSLMGPVSGKRSLADAEETPQRRQLTEAVLKKEQVSIDALLRQGYPPSRLKERIDRCRAGQVGAVVPRVVNEHVAYIPGHPEHTVLLIPHPPFAGSGFWTRKPGQRAENHARYSRSESRVKKYARLAQVVPVLAVFGRAEVRRHYADLVSTAGFHWVTVDEVAERLRGFRQQSTYG